MTKPYSLDLRERVAARIADGESVRVVAAAFQVSAASACRWAVRLRMTGSAAPRRIGGYKPRTLDTEQDWLLKRIKAEPEVTLHELLAELAERGVSVSYGTV